jgi:hypothetical protein
MAGIGPRSACVLALAVIFAPRFAAAEIYSWVDEQGELHFSNLPTNDARVKRYGGVDVESFGGNPPVVIVLEGGQERTLFPVEVTTYDDLFRRAAEHYRLPFAFLKAVAKVESNFNPRAISRAAAKGLMQLMDETCVRVDVSDPFDPEQAIFGGARYLRMLANEFGGDLVLTTAAYNAGPERVRRVGRVPSIEETTKYVERVLKLYRYYQNREGR